MSDSDKNNASLEFTGGVTRAGKQTLGVLACLSLYAFSAPTYALVLTGFGFSFWAWAYEDVGKQYNDMMAAASGQPGFFKLD